MYHKWQSQHVGFLRYEVQQTECFVILGHFLPFYPTNNPKNQNFEEEKKRKKHLEISSFFTSVPKIMIIWYTVPQIWRLTDVIVIFWFWAIFCPFTSLTAQKNQNSKKKNEKNAWRYYHFTTVHCSWDMARDECNYFSFWAIFHPFTLKHSLQNQN